MTNSIESLNDLCIEAQSFCRKLKRLEIIRPNPLPNQSFDQWWKEPANGIGDEPVQIQTIQLIIKKAKAEIDKEEDGQQEKLDRFHERLTKFIDAAGRFEKEAKNSAKKLSKRNSESKTDQWVMYFFNLTPTHRQPKLGCAILNRDTLLLNCEVKNISETSRPDYVGSFERTKYNVVNYQLDAVDEQSRLFMKVYGARTDSPNDMVFGGYLTYEHDQVIVGTVVLQKIDPDSPEGMKEAPKPGSYSPYNEEVWNKIPEEILEFVSFKQMNYLQIPHIDTKKELRRFIFNRAYDQSRRSRFINLTKKPTLFLSYTNNLIEGPDAGVVGEVLKYIREELDYPDSAIKSLELSDMGIFSPDRTIHLIKQTSLFVQLVGRTDYQSFSTLELGCAIGFAKRTLVIYESGKPAAISDKILDYCDTRPIDSFQDPTDISRIKAFIKAAIDKLSLTLDITETA